MEPRLGSRGGIVGAKVSITTESPLGSLSPDEARRLASAPSRAADLAQDADENLMPILKSFTETRDALLREEAGSR